jgi:hypothetical protein
MKRQVRISLPAVATLLLVAVSAMGQPKGPSMTVTGRSWICGAISREAITGRPISSAPQPVRKPEIRSVWSMRRGTSM